MVSLTLSSTVGEKGQVVIPKPVRDLLGISSKSEVLFSLENGKVVLEKKSGREVYQEFISVVKDKIKFGKRIDWGEECELRFIHRD